MREITRYANRKLYDARTRGYITLTGVAAAVAKGDGVRVTDRETGHDITSQTLLLAMVELEGARRGTFPSTGLASLIKAAKKRKAKK